MHHSTMKLVILDRDGIINEDRDDYVKSPEEWMPMPGALEAIARLNHAGWHAVVATNQSGIGRGLFDMATLNAMHAEDEPAAAPSTAGASTRCSSARTRPTTTATAASRCRACSQQIGERYGVDLSQVPVVGDTLRDLQAGARGRLRAAPGAHRQGRAHGRRRRSPSCARKVPGTQVHDDLAAFAECADRSASARCASPPASPTPATVTP